MRIGSASVVEDGIDVPFLLGDETRLVTFRFPRGVTASNRGDAFLSAGLFPAMVRGEPLELAEPVSDRMLEASDQVQDILTTWDRMLHPGTEFYNRVRIAAPRAVTHPPTPSDRGVASFFTGGVDSFYTALTAARVDALVYVHGFDVALADHALRAKVSDGLQAAASALDIPLLEVSTNLRDISDSCRINWEDYHGAALATIAHLLGHHFGSVLIPASTTYANMYPLGSHPLLDPLWSSDEVRIVHHGAVASRIEKLRRISQHDAPLHTLRVCWENRGGAYNCGQCEKCVRTGVAIRVAGVEGRFQSIPPPSTRQIAAINVPGLGSVWRECRDILRRTDANPRLLYAINVALARKRAKTLPGIGRHVR